MFILEGTIGAGKSTLISALSAQHPSLFAVPEPLAKWDCQGASLLENFMKNPQRWAYTMETFVMTCRIASHFEMQATQHPLTIAERSVYSGHYVFAVNSFKQGFLSRLEWNIYETFFNHFVAKQCQTPQGFIYLQTPPEVAFERVAKRNRSSETSLSIDYLKQLHERHEAFLVNKEVHENLKPTPLLVVDGTLDFVTNKTSRDALCDKIINFMIEHSSQKQAF